MFGPTLWVELTDTFFSAYTADGVRRKKMKQVFKRIIPQKYRYQLRQMKNKLDYQVLLLLSRIPFLIPFYYAALSKSFHREYRGVINGRLKNRQEIHSKQGTQYRLRRHIHGLEKGLMMVPRRAIFGVDYIEETVSCLDQASRNQEISHPLEIKWAHDTLTEYFSVVASHPVIDKARQRFENISISHQSDTFCVPYKRDLAEALSVSYQQLYSLAVRRKSVRWYLQQPVPRELIDKAILVASHSPSACNRQPYEFRIFDDPLLVSQLVSLPSGTRGFQDNIPVVAVVVGSLRAYANEWDRHLIYIDGALASMSFMLALETLGLSSCPLNWPDIGTLEKKMASLLNLEPDERVIMLISIGYPHPDRLVAYSQKKGLELLRRYN